MKKVQPIEIWKDGSLRMVTTFRAYVVTDNLIDYAIFYYALGTDSSETLAEGHLTMNGPDYQAWEQNEYAWQWVANQLGLTIVEITPSVQ